MRRWRTKSSSAALALLAWLLVPVAARAGACCVGSVTSVPTRLGECEKVGLGLTVGGEHSQAYYDRDGVVQHSSLTQQALLATVGAGVRIDRRWQVGLTAPARLNRYATESTRAWGGGPGDARVVALWDPLEERPRGSETPALPVPLLTAGLRVPTGRAWTESDAPMGEDITGLEQPAVLVGASIERTLDRWPWSLGTTAEVGVVPGVQPTVQTIGTLGRTLGAKWTVVGSGRHTLSWASLEPGVRAVHSAHVGGRIVHGRPVRWRVFTGAETSLPVDHLGAGAALQTTVTAGALMVR